MAEKETDKANDTATQSDDWTYDWKEYKDGMQSKMVSERLREAIGRRHKGMLLRAISDANHAGITQDEDLTRAKHLVKIIDQKQKLKEVVSSGNLESISHEIDVIKKSGLLMSHMQREVQEAERFAEALTRFRKLNRAILDMDKRTMSEVRRYHNPPASVHLVMQATLLLLGEDELTTADWRACQKFMNPTGPDSMNKRIMDYDINSAHEEIIARVRQMLDMTSLNEIHPISRGTATFYVWAMSMVEEFELKNGKSSKAASVDLQRQLFGKPRRRASPVRKRKIYTNLGTPRTGTLAGVPHAAERPTYTNN